MRSQSCGVRTTPTNSRHGLFMHLVRHPAREVNNSTIRPQLSADCAIVNDDLSVRMIQERRTDFAALCTIACDDVGESAETPGKRRKIKDFHALAAFI